LPSIAFLEYLADMTEVDGKYYGPQDMRIEACKDSVNKPKNQNDITNNTANNTTNGDKNEKAQENDKAAKMQECNHND
jgi:hypothetical protein